MMHAYWAWFWPSGDRRAYKQMFDPICAMSMLARVNSSILHPDQCVVCMKRITGMPDVLVYGTLYLPNRDRKDVELPHDAACFEVEADWYMQGAQRLIDRPGRGLEAGGPPPPGDPWADWDRLLEST